MTNNIYIMIKMKMKQYSWTPVTNLFDDKAAVLNSVV